MMSHIATIALALFTQQAHGSGPGYFACMAACCSFSIPLGSCVNPALTASCAAGCALCFDGDNAVLSKNSSKASPEVKSLKELKTGDWVTTLDDSFKPAWTQVVRNVLIEEKRAFVRIVVYNQETSQQRSVRVTARHNLVSVDAGDKAVLRSAHLFRVGDVVIGEGGKRDIISEIENYTDTNRWVLHTKSANVLVAGYLASTMCDLGEDTHDSDYLSTLHKWRAEHGSTFDHYLI